MTIKPPSTSKPSHSYGWSTPGLRSITALLLGAVIGSVAMAGKVPRPASAAVKVSPELQAVSDRAYMYAYSIDKAYVHLYETLVKPDYPANRFQAIRHLADDKYTAHPTINNDTLHLMGWLDVAAEPVIVSVPDHDEGRYWVLQTMDMGHYTTSLFGRRTRGTQGGRFMFVNQTWKGDVPQGITEVVRVESNFIKLMGRVMATGKDDEKKALTYVNDWNIRTLSEFLGQNGPKPKVRKFVPDHGNTWLERVNFMLADGTMASADAHWLKGLEASGIGAGKTKFTPEQLAAARVSEQHVNATLKAALANFTHGGNSLGTREALGHGDRVAFSIGTFIGQWGAPPVEATYMQLVKSSDGAVLNGANDYSITFVPPKVSQFWSLTAYGSKSMLMIANDLNRHSRGDRHVKLNADGTATIRLSNRTAGKAEDSNFLPVPNEDFYLMLRMYGGDLDIQEGKFPLPVVQKTAK
jgi:hypothetical protein